MPAAAAPRLSHARVAPRGRNTLPGRYGYEYCFRCLYRMGTRYPCPSIADLSQNTDSLSNIFGIFPCPNIFPKTGTGYGCMI